MTITIHYPGSGHSRTQKNIPQSLCNILITQLSRQNEFQHVPVVVTVRDDEMKAKDELSPVHRELVRIADHINEQQLG